MREGKNSHNRSDALDDAAQPASEPGSLSRASLTSEAYGRGRTSQSMADAARKGGGLDLAQAVWSRRNWLAWPQSGVLVFAGLLAALYWHIGLDLIERVWGTTTTVTPSWSRSSAAS